jgi:hypothetical protein
MHYILHIRFILLIRMYDPGPISIRSPTNMGAVSWCLPLCHVKQAVLGWKRS